MKKHNILIILSLAVMLLAACSENELTKVNVDETTSDNIELDSVKAEDEREEDNNNEEINTDEAEEQSVSSFNPDLPTYTENGVWYEIFVRAFADSNGDGIGDLKGITNKLDYLNDGDPESSNDLGVNGLWLMPISPSPSYHGYDVTDYYEVNPEYGTMEDFEELIAEAHKRDVKIIIDLVLNHSSYQHPWFQEAINNPESQYRDYYRIVDKDSEGYNFQKFVWNHPVWNEVGNDYYYAIFWDQMPDLNYDNKALRDEMINVAKFWLNKGVDGFRIDAVSHIFGSGELPKGTAYDPLIDEWWNEFNQELRNVNPNYYLVGEAWEPLDSRIHYNSFFDSTFNFDVAESSILAMAKNEIDYDANNNGLVTELGTIYAAYDELNVPFIDAPFLTNHDQRRAMDYLNGDVVDMKLSANIYMTLPGNPFIYYGEEIGMTGNKPDENIREPFVWGINDEAQTSWKSYDYNEETMSVLRQQRVPDSLLNHYKELIKLRQDNPALLSGGFVGIETQSPRVVVYTRSNDEQNIAVIHNLASEAININFTDIGIKEVGEVIYSSSEESIINGDSVNMAMKSTIIIEY